MVYSFPQFDNVFPPMYSALLRTGRSDIELDQMKTEDGQTQELDYSIKVVSQIGTLWTPGTK